MRPILVVIGILSFIGTYGDFVMARILLKSTEQYTLMVGLQIFTSGQFSQKWGAVYGWGANWRAADYDHLSGFAGSDCGWPDARVR